MKEVLTANEIKVNEIQIHTEMNQIQKNKIVEGFLNNNLMRDLELTTYFNEKNNDASFESFSDRDLIYYYLHMDTYDDEEKNRKKGTKQEYIRDLLQFYLFVKYQIDQECTIDQEQAPESYLKSLHKRQIREYQDWLKNIVRENGKIGYAPATRTRRNAVVKGFLKWLFDEDVIDHPLNIAFKKSTTKKRERPDRSLSLEEVQQLLEYYQDHPINHAILLTLFTTGLRVDEISSAKWSDIYQDSTVREGAYYLKVIGKGGVERHARLMEPTMESIKRMREIRRLPTIINQADHSPLFCTNKGKAYHFKYMSNYVISIIKKTNYEFLKRKEGNVSPHWARHFFVNYSVIELGLPIEVVQQTVGHSSKSTTESYLDKHIQKKNDASLHWDDSLFKPIKST